MKKHYMGILAVLIAFCIALVGCGGGGSETPAEPEPEQQEQAVEPEPEQGPTQDDFDAVFAGEWELVAYNSEDSEVTEDDIKSIKDTGFVTVLTLAQDGTASIDMFGDNFLTGDWNASSMTECLIVLDGERINSTFDESTGRLSLVSGDVTLFFEKSGSAPKTIPDAPSTASDSDYTTLDSKGNPTLYAVVELDGSDLVKVIEDEGFEWADDNKWWLSSDGNDAFYISGANDYEYLRNEITGLAVNGKGDPCVYVIVVDDRDYSSAEDVFDKLNNLETLEETWVDEAFGAAIVEGPSGVQNFVVVSYTEDPGLYNVDIFNEDAITSGIIDEYLGDNYGHSIDELRNNLF